VTAGLLTIDDANNVREAVAELARGFLVPHLDKALRALGEQVCWAARACRCSFHHEFLMQLV
jgi:hypothetical protein